MAEKSSPFNLQIKLYLVVEIEVRSVKLYPFMTRASFSRLIKSNCKCIDNKLTINPTGLPLFDLTNKVEEALRTALDEINARYARHHLYRVAKASVTRVCGAYNYVNRRHLK